MLLPVNSEAELSRSIKIAEKEKRAHYERFIRCEIGIDEFKAAKAPLDAEIERLVLTHETLMSEIGKMAEANELRKQLRELTETAFKDNTLTQPLADLLIDRVNVFPDGKVDIVWKLSMFESVERKDKEKCQVA